MTMPTAADFRSAFDAFDDLARDATWYPGAVVGDPRAIRILVRQLKAEEQVGTLDGLRFLATVRHDEIEGQSGGVVPEPYDWLTWDGQRRLIRDVRTAEVGGGVVVWKLGVAA